jgi:hypothetical protein
MSAYHRTDSVSVITLAANHFLDSLTPEQKAIAMISFESDERQNWFYTPVPRKGLQLREMSPYQKRLATALLAAGLSQQGFIKAETIMSLEDVLRIAEKDDGERRNPEKYYFSIFGTPSDSKPWGYRVEGHHVSQNYTVVGGKIVDTPSFFGSNPREVLVGPRKGLRVLAQEEDAGRAFMESLNADQQKTATVDKEAYKDILTTNSRQAALKGQPSGLSATQLNDKQFGLLTDLLNMYADNMPEQMAMARMQRVKAAGKNIYFAWAGVVEKGGPHYYRVQSPTFLVEYDCTQDKANHIHSVWRDFNGDFGMDVLKQHYQTSHNE